MACGRTSAVTHLAKSISLFFLFKKGRKTRALLSFAALQDRRALLLGYVKNDVVTLDQLALLWTIETACGSSLSRAPETHLAILHLLQSPPVGRTTAPFFKSWPWLVPRYALVANAPGLRSLGGYGARSHAGQCVRFPRSARPTTPQHGNIYMLPIRAGTTKRQRWWPSVTGLVAGICLKGTA